MKISITKKGHFYKGLLEDSYNINKLMVKKWDDNKILNTLKKHSQFQKCGILKKIKFQVCTFEDSEFQNFERMYHI